MTEFERRYKTLNPAQKEAVDSIFGPVLVIAGPGTGKTELLSMRVAQILQQTDVFPENILCMTFTDSGSDNMRSRLTHLIGHDAYKVDIQTFHSFGSDIIGRYREHFFEGAHMLPSDEIISIEILHEILKDLPYKHILKTEHPTQGFLYIKDIKQRIGDLKKAGMTPKMLKDILESSAHFLSLLEPLLKGFFGGSRISKNIFDALPSLIEKITSLEDTSIMPFGLRSYKELILSELLTCHDLAPDTKPLTAFKSKYLEKTDTNSLAFKDVSRWKKYTGLVDVYTSYQEALYAKGYYDFDDMLIEAIRIIKEHPHVRYDLLEKYQFIMIDEFQDTSGLQMQLISLLCEDDSTPNILCVGDDDQSIFKFQGANITNFLEFGEKFPDKKIISLTDNYRSTKEILEFSRKIILQGNERFETMNTGISKELRFHRDEPGTIIFQNAETELDELYFVADHIQKYLDDGEDPKNISVISPKHSYLQDLSTILQAKKIPVAYEKKQNIFAIPEVSYLISLLNCLHTLTKTNPFASNEILSCVLSFPFWEIDRRTIWNISKTAFEQGQSWMDIMLNSEDVQLTNIANFLLDLSQKTVAGESVERILDALIGSTESIDGAFISPYYSYYFTHLKNGIPKYSYLSLLSHLRTFIEALRSHKKKELLTVNDALSFFEIYDQYDLPLNDYNIYEHSGPRITLQSAHKSKGLEYKIVFVLHATDKAWCDRSGIQKLTFPKHLPLSPDNDDIDDHLRLFFVAITRAKQDLVIVSHKLGTKGKPQSLLRFLAGEPLLSTTTVNYIQSENVLQRFETDQKYNDFTESEKDMLRGYLKDYQLSITHLENFINLEYGGPEKFLEKNLLRFPTPMDKDSCFGSSMHITIQRVYTYLKQNNILPSLIEICEMYQEILQGFRLPKKDFDEMLAHGIEKLTIYMDQRKNYFDKGHFIEQDFRNEGVVVDNVPLTGKIDKMILHNTFIEVVDLKTGSIIHNFTGKMKGLNYKYQLIFYKLLVENSRTFGRKYRVHDGAIEFLVDDHGEIKILPLHIEQKDVDELTKLIIAVYNKIMNLDFPDVSGYEKNLRGTKKFIEDLIQGNI